MSTTDINDRELEVHEEGQEAFWNGLDNDECPYDINSEAFLWWQEGYNDPRGEIE